jgi:hypothetical protein
MANTRIKLYTDEDVNPIIATHLCQNGYDVLSTHEAGRANQGISDDEQLEYATQQCRTIFTFNFKDYIELDIQWRARNKVHTGIIVSKRIENIGELIGRLKYHIDILPPEIQNNLLLWLA